MDRLFVPLKSEPFQWFKSGKKEWELRGINRNFNEDTVKENRKIELRKGYNGESLWGKITQVKTFQRVCEERSLEKRGIGFSINKKKDF